MLRRDASRLILRDCNDEMSNLDSGSDNFDVREVTPTAQLVGNIDIPGDKSISHRALMFNSFAEGVANIDGLLESDDIHSTMECLRALDAHISASERDSFTVNGRGIKGLRQSESTLDCGNSGTTARLLTGIVSGLGIPSVISGDESLSTRPMARIIQPLNQMGVRISGRSSDTLLPLEISGSPTIQDGLVIETGVASAQVKSAILLCAVVAGVSVTVIEPRPSRDHSERLLSAMGASLEYFEDDRGHGVRLLKRTGELRAVDVTVPGDISTAAPWVAAGILHDAAEITLKGVGVNPSRTGIIDILKLMGGNIELKSDRVVGGEPVADLVARSGKLHGTVIGGDLIPRAIDEIPLVALAATQAEGETVIHDASELRAKESDRIDCTVEILTEFGADIDGTADGFVIRGPTKLQAATVDSYGDHRLAMLGAVAGLLASGVSQINGASAVTISYPEFWDRLASLGTTA